MRRVNPFNPTFRGHFAQCFTQTFHAPGVRETVPNTNTEFSGLGTLSATRTANGFAFEVRTLLRETGANLSGGYHEKLPIRMVAKLEVSTVLPCFPLATIAVNLGVSLAERGFAKTNPMNKAKTLQIEVEWPLSRTPP